MPTKARMLMMIIMASRQLILWLSLIHAAVILNVAMESLEEELAPVLMLIPDLSVL